MLTSQDVKDFARRAGADLVGIAPMDRWEGAPKQCDPRYIAPNARSMIVMGFRIARGTLRGIEEGTYFISYASMGYAAINFVRQPMVCWDVTNMLEDEGYESVPIPNNFPWNNSDMTGRNPQFIGEHNPARSVPVSPDKPAPDVFIHLRIAAFIAGMGEIGWSKMFLTPRFGPRQRFAAILTTAPLEPDPIYEGPQLCDRCMLCAQQCTGGAISTTESVKIKVAGHNVEYARIDNNLCQTYFAGASEQHNPFMVNEDDRKGFQEGWTNNYKMPPIYEYGRALEGARGCIRACMVHLEEQGKLSNTFTEPFRQKKQWQLEWPRPV